MIKYICTRVVFSGQQRFYSMEQAVSQSAGQSAPVRGCQPGCGWMASIISNTSPTICVFTNYKFPIDMVCRRTVFVVRWQQRETEPQTVQIDNEK